METLTLQDVVRGLERRYPPRTAEPWDSVGLVVGDPGQEVKKILFAMDPVATVVDEALEWGADLIVTHHPLLLRGITSVAATSAKGSIIHRLISGGCALYTAHTNADSALQGVNDALADAIGLVDLEPLVPAAGPDLDKHVVFVPTEPEDLLLTVVDAMSEAGAGQIGDYSGCHWQVAGTGSFRPEAGASPTIGAVGKTEFVSEHRLEMIAPASRRAAVVRAMRQAHPYEEPAFDVLNLAQLPAPTGLGRVGRLPAPLTLRQFAQQVAAALPATEQGIRVAGDAEARIQRVAVCSGSGDSLFDQVRAAQVDAYVTSDLRHHPASEARETALLGTGTPYLIDTAHFASEWPWLRYGARDIAADLAASGFEVQVRVSERRTDPWDFRVASPNTSSQSASTARKESQL